MNCNIIYSKGEAAASHKEWFSKESHLQGIIIYLISVNLCNKRDHIILLVYYRKHNIIYMFTVVSVDISGYTHCDMALKSLQASSAIPKLKLNFCQCLLQV